MTTRPLPSRPYLALAPCRRLGAAIAALLLAGLAACEPVRTTTPVADDHTIVTFLSDPPGAEVRVNGVLLPGSTPLQHHTLAPGFVQVEMTVPGYRRALHQQTLEPGSALRIDLRLEALATPTPTETPIPMPTPSPQLPIAADTPTPTATLPPTPSPTPQPSPPTATPTALAIALVSFASEPPGATVLLEGRPLGVTPLDDQEVPAGARRMSFSLAGFETVDLERTWEPGERDRVEAVLFPLRGTVRFRSDPAWSAIAVDGEAIELRPDEPLELIEGQYQVRASRGAEVATAEFAVAAGVEVQVDLKWRRGLPDIKRYALVPAATAMLGDDRFGEDNPPRQTRLAGFWIGRTEVTVQQYEACVAAGACAAAGRGPGCNAGIADRERHPINCVRVADADAFAVWRRQETGLGQRLPSCDEWEHAARRGGRYPWGDAQPEGRCNTCDASCPFVNFRTEVTDDGFRETAPVGALADCRDGAGVFDMVGNVAEWCRGDAGYQVRGGSWGQVGVFLEPAFAVRRDADDRDPTVGFRLAIPE